jgi:YggT family protein
MDIILVPLLYLLINVIWLYKWALVVYVILTWLEHFRVINSYSPFVYNLNNFLFRIIEPVLYPIRRVLPNLGGIDISPIILIFILSFFQMMLEQLLFKFPS